MDKSKLVAHTSSLNTHLQYYLNKFEKNQQWADIAPLLQKIEILLKQHPSPYIREKIQLSKRLGQCLNPQLSAPIHSSVLKIYDLLFANMANFDVDGDTSGSVKLVMEDLALYSIGLFPFFQNASSKVRPQFLDLIQQHYVPLSRELVPMIPGLVASILPGLDDQQEVIQKKCITVIDNLGQAVGRRYLMGAVWMTMVRSPKCRSAAIKYLSQRIEKMVAEEDQDEDNDDSFDSDQEPVALARNLDDANNNNLALAQDKMLTDNNPQLIEDDRVADLAEQKNALNEIRSHTVLVEQEAETKRKQDLLQLEHGIDENEPVNNFPTIHVTSIISCLEDDNQLIKRQMLDFMYTHLKSQYVQEYKEQLVQAALRLLIKKDLSVTRRVNQWLFGKPDMENKYQITEANKGILEYIADAFNRFFDEQPTDQTAVIPLKLLQNFFMEHDHMVELIIHQISYNMIAYVERYHKQYPEIVKSCKRLLESITSYLLVTVKSITTRFNSLISFLFTVLITKEDNYDPAVEFTILRTAAANLMNAISAYSLEEWRQNKPGKTLEIIFIRMEQLPNKTDNSLIDAHQANYDQSLNHLGALYQNIADQILEGQQDDEILVQLESMSRAIVKGQKFMHDKEVKQLPGWFTSITKIIKEDNPSISLIAIQSMIEILISEKVDLIYENLRKMIIEESKSKLIKNQLIEGQDYTKLTLEKLWNLLDYPFFHDRIIEMIVNLSKVFPTFFTEVVIFQFRNMQEAAIRRFAVFWKLSAHYFKELQDLNKVGLFLMLDFLDHENPIIRHNAKNWLLESTGMLQRILDPLFEVLIQSSSSWYVTEKQQIFFAKVYETKRINETIKKLKSILISFSSRFMEYVEETEISQYIKDIRMHFTNESSVIMRKEQMMYLDLLVIICLKYVQGQAIESMSQKFYRENAAVNASACEYIELLITNVENPMVSLRFAEYIMEPLQIVLFHAIENEDLVMQVQILNLFKVIFFNSAFRTKFTQDQRELIEDSMSRSISNKIFIPTLIRGMHTGVLYVRAQYIQFISTCIPLLAEHLRQNTLTDCVQYILQAYFKMIQSIANRQYEAQESSIKQMNQFDYLQGSSQHEIQTILIGVKTILKHILGLVEREDIQYEKFQEQVSMLGYVKNVLTFGLLNVTETNKIQKLTFLKFQRTCEVIISTLPSILELYVNCWESSADFLKYADTLTTLGIGSYSFEKLNLFNKYLTEYKDQVLKDQNVVKPQILLMMKPLFMNYSRDFMTAILSVWNTQCQGHSKLFLENGQPIIVDPYTFSQNTLIQKTVELMVLMQCPMELFLESLLESQQILDLQKYYDIYRRKKLTTPMLNFQIAQQESSILFFLYCYFSFAYIDSNQLKRDALLGFWNTIMKFMLIMGQSKAPSTNIWLIELQLLLTRKYSPKEIVNDQRFRNCHHEFVNEKLKYLAQFGARMNQIFWNDPSQKVEDEDGATYYAQRFKIILPLPPTLYDLYLQVVLNLKAVAHFETTEIEKILFLQLATVTEDEIYSVYRLMCLKTLKGVSLELLQNSYAVEKTDRVVLRTREYMDILFPLMENRSLANQIYVQAVSELVYHQLDKARQFLIKAYRQPILDLFNREDFFNQNKYTLRYWTKIINWVVTNDKNDLFTEYLDKVTLQSSFFSKESEENKKRIKSFERICFVIFSGERDKFTKKLAMLIEKISEVIKTDQVHPGLEILILFCVRILILRLSPLQLNELFRNMWPTLLSLLMQIFKNKQANINLVLAALKLVEMISLMRQDEFFLHQWIFIYDYFGLRLEESDRSGTISPFLYQPQFANYLQQQHNFKVNYVEQIREEVALQKREIIIQQIKVDNMQQLEDVALKLCNYLIKLNSARTHVNLEDIEQLIERDFIQLDEFIYDLQ